MKKTEGIVVKESNGRIEIHTNLGDIVVQPAPPPAFPGVWIDFVRPGSKGSEPICVAEAILDTDGKSAASIRLLVYGEDAFGADREEEFIFAQKETPDHDEL